MNELLEFYNNKNIKITLFDVEYSAILINDNNELILNLIDYVNRDTALKLDRTFKIINGRFENRDITFFNTICSSRIYNSGFELFSLTFRIDRFIESIRYTSEKNKIIKTANIQFYSLENFSLSNFYDYDKKLNPIFKTKHKEYEFNEYKIRIFVGNRTTSGDSIYKCEKKLYFFIDYKKKQTLQRVIKDIWSLKCFMAIISKRIIGIKSIDINENAKLFMNFIYFNDKNNNNEFFEHEYKSFVFNLEDLENDFILIYEQFLKIFNEILPALKIYLDMIEKEPSSMNKFLNCNQIIEYISKEYDNTNSHNVWVKNGKPSKAIRLADRIESILNEVNFIWKFRKSKINKIASKIAIGRNYYNHHTKPVEPLIDDELFRFSYFLEDIILGYIYNKMGVNKKTIEEKLHYNMYYEKKHIK